MSTSKQQTTVVSDKQRTLTSYIMHSRESPNPTQIKHNISNLSPPESEPIQKKTNMDESRNGITQLSGSIDSNHVSNSNGITKSKQHDTKYDDHIVTNPIVNSQVPSELIGNIVEPLILEMRLLKDSVHDGYAKLEGVISTQQATIAKLETSITTQQLELNKDISGCIEESNVKIKECLEQNRQLWKENSDLKERLNKIELNQLGNNVIITGVQEQPWEGYSTTKERVLETIATAMGGNQLEESMKEARKINISCCSHIGKYQLNRP